MAASVERIVVKATAAEKKAFVAKARKLGVPTSELMRRGAAAYVAAPADEELGLLADSATSAAERAVAAIDDALAFVDASNQRIAALERKARAAAAAAKRSRIRKAA